MRRSFLEEKKTSIMAQVIEFLLIMPCFFFSGIGRCVVVDYTDAKIYDIGDF